MELISQQVLGANTSTVTLSSIPGTYRDLFIVLNLISTTGGTTVFLQPNGETSNLSAVAMTGDGSTASSSTYSSLTANPISISDTQRTFNVIYSVMDYSQTNKHKTFIYRANQTIDPIYNSFYGAGAFVGRWASLSAITSLTFALGAFQFAAGSTITLYGIRG